MPSVAGGVPFLHASRALRPRRWVMRDSSFTLRFDDGVGVRIATRAIGTALTSVAAPRAVVDDIRLAVEMALAAADGLAAPEDEPTASGDGGPDGSGDRESECVLAVACRSGRIGLEMRLPGRVEVDRATLLALVDEVDVRPDGTTTTIGLDRTWFVGPSPGTSTR